MNSLPWVLVPSSSQLLEDDERFVLEDVMKALYMIDHFYF